MHAKLKTLIGYGSALAQAPLIRTNRLTQSTSSSGVYTSQPRVQRRIPHRCVHGHTCACTCIKMRVSRLQRLMYPFTTACAFPRLKDADFTYCGGNMHPQVVLGHLTSNACEVFKMLVQFQLEHPRSAGLSFPELYQRARANFFATSEGALRKHINEFQTHDLVRTRQGPGGQQCYWCHFPGETLQQLLEQSTEGMPLS